MSSAETQKSLSDSAAKLRTLAKQIEQMFKDAPTPELQKATTGTTSESAQDCMRALGYGLESLVQAQRYLLLAAEKADAYFLEL